jgi:hypothetical protein
MLRYAVILILAAAALSLSAADAPPTPLDVILKETQPLATPHGKRLPIYVWTAEYPQNADDAELERIIKELDARGISLLTRWSAGNFEKSCAFALCVGKILAKLGIPVAVEAENDTINGFSDGSPAVAHVDADGKPFFDDTFMVWKAGCPFKMATRYDAMKAKLEPFLKKYKESGVPLDFWTADFEFDGPDEWNTSWEKSKKCTVCAAKIKNLDTDFKAFQNAVRTVRTEMQNEVFSKTIRSYFPAARFGVYGMNPNDGFRYWWDFFEKKDEIAGVDYKKDNGAVYRPWAKEFDASGYSMAMPVIYSLYNPYTFKNGEYGWFYNMLLEYSAAAKNTPPGVAMVPFLHWSVTAPNGQTPLSEEKYQELLWHLLLRRCDGFCMWCQPELMAKNIVPLQKVYAESQSFADFLEKGKPITFEVPSQPGTVVSGLRLDKKVLIRRTDFEPNPSSVEVLIDQKPIKIPSAPGKCQVLDVP